METRLNTIVYQTINSILLALLLILTLGCDKNDDTLPETEILQTKNLVSQYVVSGEIHAVTYNSKGYVTSFGSEIITYDAQNKVIGSGGVSYGYDDQNRIIKANRTDFEYNSNDLISTTTNANSKNSYEYNDKNQLVSVLFYGGPNAIPINYGGPNAAPIGYGGPNAKPTGYGGPNANPVGYGGPNAAPTFKAILTYDEKGNISQILTQEISNGVKYTDIYLSRYVYDGHKNPNYNLIQHTGIEGSFSPVVMFSPSLGIFYQFFYSPNNLISIEVQALNGGITQNTKYSYTYNDGEYPISAVRTISDSLGNKQTSTLSWSYKME